MFEIGLVQCKTNWNDNAQIPMLWDLLYRVEEFENDSVRIGGASVTIKDLAKFSYSFVTVPSGVAEYKEGSVPVKRVHNLKGGNYWGRPTKQGVALSLDEIFRRNFSSAFDGSISDCLKLTFARLEGEYDYFQLTTTI